MMNGDVESEWKDITKEFKDACNDLKVGELLHDNNFGLFEAMSAFEMMDPKMDSGIIGLLNKQTNVETPPDLKLKDFAHGELLTIFDGTLCCVATWLEGGAMAQTVFASLYLHDPFRIEDRILKAYCLGVMKLVAICKDVITSTCVYEDEHFQPSTYGFLLTENLSDQRCIGMLKEAEDELGKILRNVKSKLQDCSSDEATDSKDLADVESLLARIRIVKLLISTILGLRYSGPPVTDEAITKGLGKLKEIINSVTASIKGDTHVNPLDLPTFDISTTSRLLPPSFPRAVQLMSPTDTLNMLYSTCSQLETVVGIPKKIGLVEAMDYFDKFTTNQTPSILVRSLLLYHFMPSGTGKVYNKTKLTDLICDELRYFSCPPVVNPAFKSTLMAHDHFKLILPAFLSSGAHVLENLFAAKCNTRARQRERLAFLLEELGVLQAEAERVDSVVDAILREKLGEKALAHMASGIGTWTLYLTTRCMVTYLTLGMELELYDIREYCYLFWYLSEVILLWNTSSLFRAEKSLSEPPHVEPKSAGGRKKNKQKKPKSIVNIHQEELLMSRCKQHISGGLHKLLLALKLANMLPTTGDYTYDNELVRYTHRFAPFGAVNFPQLVSYESYMQAVGVNDQTPPFVIIDFLRQSFNNFETCRGILDSDALKCNAEAAAMLSVAKNNLVVTKILADSLQKDVKRSVKFDFSFHKVFPLIKFAT